MYVVRDEPVEVEQSADWYREEHLCLALRVSVCPQVLFRLTYQMSRPYMAVPSPGSLAKDLHASLHTGSAERHFLYLVSSYSLASHWIE
jgi:hypothetical protein